MIQNKHSMKWRSLLAVSTFLTSSLPLAVYAQIQGGTAGQSVIPESTSTDSSASGAAGGAFEPGNEIGGGGTPEGVTNNGGNITVTIAIQDNLNTTASNNNPGGNLGATVNSSSTATIAPNAPIPDGIRINVTVGVTANSTGSGTVANVSPNQVAGAVSNALAVPGSTSVSITISNTTFTVTQPTAVAGGFQTTTITIANAGGATQTIPIVGTTAQVQAAIGTAAILTATGASPATVQLGAAIASGSGASPQFVAAVATAMAGLFTGSGPTAFNSVNNGELVASSSLNNLGLIAQNGTPNVNVTKLAAAINAYNNLLINSSPDVVVALSKNQEFLEVGKLLRELRSVIK